MNNSEILDIIQIIDRLEYIDTRSIINRLRLGEIKTIYEIKDEIEKLYFNTFIQRNDYNILNEFEKFSKEIIYFGLDDYYFLLNLSELSDSINNLCNYNDYFENQITNNTVSINEVEYNNNSQSTNDDNNNNLIRVSRPFTEEEFELISDIIINRLEFNDKTSIFDIIKKNENITNIKEFILEDLNDKTIHLVINFLKKNNFDFPEDIGYEWIEKTRKRKNNSDLNKKSQKEFKLTNITPSLINNFINNNNNPIDSDSDSDSDSNSDNEMLF